MKRKLWIWVAAALLCLTCTGLAACGEKTPSTANVVLVNFTDTESSAEIGTVYTVENPAVLDEDGNSYQPEYAVYVGTGNESATVIGGQIELQDLAGYRIVYTVELSENDSRTRTHRISVTDSVDPVVRIAQPAYGVAGQEYTLPEVTVSDNSGASCTVEEKLYLVNGGQKTEVAFTDGRFTPAAGDYSYEVTATDASGNAAGASVTFNIATPMADYVLADFADSADLITTDSVYAANGAQKGWEQTFMGADGVGWMTGGDQQYKNFALRFGRTQEEMEAYEQAGWAYFAVRLYIDAEGSFQIMNWNVRYLNVDGTTTQQNPVPGKQWVTVYLAQSDIEGARGDTYWQNSDYTGSGSVLGLDAFNSSCLREEGFTMFWVSGPLADDSRIYVDEMRLVKSPGYTVQTDKSEYYDGDTVSFTVSNPNDAAYTMTVTGPEGEVACSGNSFVADVPGKYTISLVSTDGEYVGGYTLHIEVKARFTVAVDALADCIVGDTVTLPAAIVKNAAGEQVPDAQVTVTVTCAGKEVQPEDGSFVAETGGEYLVVYSYTAQDKVYSTQFTFTAERENFYTSFETQEEFAGASNVERSGEQQYSREYSAKFNLPQEGAALYSFSQPVKQNIVKIGLYIYVAEQTDAEFVYNIGAYQYGGGSAAPVSVSAEEYSVPVSLAAGWNYYEFAAEDVRGMLLGGLVSFGFKGAAGTAIYADDLYFLSSDITFENAADAGLTWDGHVTALQSDEQAHSGKYSARADVAPNTGVYFIWHQSPIKVQNAEKVGLWIYNGGKEFDCYFSYMIPEYVNSEGQTVGASQDVNQPFVLKAGGWHYYQFDVNDVEGIATAGISEMMLWSGSSAAGTVYVDDITFTDVDLTFEADDDHSAAWDTRAVALKSDQNALSGEYSAEVPCTQNGMVYFVWHQSPKKAQAEKIAMWIYNGGNAFTCSFSLNIGAYTNGEGEPVSSATDMNIPINGHIVQGWGYYEFTITDTEGLALGGVIQLGFWSGAANAGTIYVDNISFI